MTAADLESWPVVPDPDSGEIDRVRQYAVAHGGAALQGLHRKRHVVFNAKSVTRTPRREELVSCYQPAMFTLPVDDIDPTLADRDTNYCVVDDAAHLWPRFR